MKTAMIAFASILIAAPAALASYQDVVDNYEPGAFSDKDEDWVRITTNRYGECGEFGSDGSTRLEVLMARYNQLGDALESGNQNASQEAAKSLSAAIQASTRFEGCWDKVSGRAGISRSFKRNLEKL
ncbi:hypothetical protein [Hyphococcus sp.]|uniref:hypothetical protein n=1 Tax=Hyphococcus sp. TaxID=2038636 RepID=UPI003CCC3B4D